MKGPFLYGFGAMGMIALGGIGEAQPATVAEKAAKSTEVLPEGISRVPDTLMFTIDELTDIQNRLASTEEDADSERTEEAIENAALYLSTIVYYSPQDWTIWVNNKPIGPRQDFSSFKITAIGPRFVELVVPLSAQGMKPVRLEPNQTFISRSGDVVEGVWKH